jgi:hypothetical protein
VSASLHGLLLTGGLGCIPCLAAIITNTIESYLKERSA